LQKRSYNKTSMKINKEAKRGARKLFRACFVNGHLDEKRVRDTVKAIAEKKPRHYLGILQSVEKLVRTETQKHTMTLESATPLDQGHFQTLQKQVEGHFKKTLISSHKVNPKLIGGVRLKVGSNVWDGSVAAKLQQISKH
jgi:F-type H+-transporting ATPase subunit delta